MIKQTIFPRINIHIPAISKSYRFNGGSATVQLDSLGNYEMLVNGNRFSSLENSAKRDTDYKPAVNDVSLKMITAFDKRDAEFTAMHKKAGKVQKLLDQQKKIDSLTLGQYEREKFPLARPMREEIRRELEAEAEARFVDLYDDKRKERVAFVNSHENEAMAARLRAYEEVQTFFNSLQDDKETKANAAYKREYNRQKSEIDAFINGDSALVEKNLRMLLGELSLPYCIEISCEYEERLGLLNTEVELHRDMDLPNNKTNLLSTGKISVKDRLVREMEQFKTETIVSMVYYIAASLFNATINIRTQRVTLWMDGKREGMLWIQFDREKFAKLSMRTVTPMLNYYDWPRVDALRMVRGASQLDTMDAVSFKNAISQTMKENDIVEPTPRTASVDIDSDMTTVSIEYARTVADALPSDQLLQSLVTEAIRTGAKKVVLPKKYKGILNELRN